MTEVKNVRLVKDIYGDWVGIYVNGELKNENHSLDESQVLQALGLSFDELSLPLEEMGLYQLPETWKELQTEREKFKS